LELSGRRDGDVQHLLNHPGLHQILVRPTQRIVIGHLLEADIRAPVRAVLQQRHQTAITLPLMLTQHQAGEQLRPGEILAAELRLVFLHACRRQRIGGIQHRPW